MGDLSPAKCINPMGVRAAGSGGLGCGEEVARSVLSWAGSWLRAGRGVCWSVAYLCVSFGVSRGRPWARRGFRVLRRPLDSV
eukprot:3111714-Alexandrium_andersonii.AAC.1